MELTYLAIENDVSVHDRESKHWLSHNISSIRVSTMYEGIQEAMIRRYLYIGINAANIKYLPTLKYLREVTDVPILISTTTYTMQEQAKAINLGADLFGQISNDPTENFEAVMALVGRVHNRSEQQVPFRCVVVRENILMSKNYRQAFVGDIEIDLTNKEFELLYHLLSKEGQAMSFKELYVRIWGSKYTEAVNVNIKNAVVRLRKKIEDAGGDSAIIETIWGYGFRSRLVSGKKPKNR